MPKYPALSEAPSRTTRFPSPWSPRSQPDLALARQAAADAKRYQNLVAPGDVSRSAFERARTQQYEAALNGARQSWGAVENSQASLAGVTSQLAQPEKGLADTTIRAPFDGAPVQGR